MAGYTTAANDWNDINLLYFFFFLILPTSDKRGILAVTVITLFHLRTGLT
jgi:hypothetical protein